MVVFINRHETSYCNISNIPRIIPTSNCEYSKAGLVVDVVVASSGVVVVVVVNDGGNSTNIASGLSVNEIVYDVSDMALVSVGTPINIRNAVWIKSDVSGNVLYIDVADNDDCCCCDDTFANTSSIHRTPMECPIRSSSVVIATGSSMSRNNSATNAP